jgi:hypothetical protein
MARKTKRVITDEQWQRIVLRLPDNPPSPQGGRSWLAYRGSPKQSQCPHISPAWSQSLRLPLPQPAEEPTHLRAEPGVVPVHAMSK